MAENKREIDPKSTPTKDLHQYLVGAVAPRPIAFVSTKNADGTDNVAPYSFFNAFSSNPPIVVFSSNRRVRDNTTKDTLRNIEEQREAVINMVNYSIVRQMSLASVEFESGVDEFAKVGLTPASSKLVKASRVAESPVNMEVKVKDIITLGEHGGAGHLIICEVVMIHIDEAVMDEDRIDTHKLDLMGRLGRAYYVRASGSAIHTIYQDILTMPLGFDQLDKSITSSPILSGNDIAQLASLISLPNNETLVGIKNLYQIGDLSFAEIHTLAKEKIANAEVEEALAILYARLP